jgi:hypothetical protein
MCAQSSPPQPLAQELQIIDVPAYDVWVKTFGGYAPQDEVVSQVRAGWEL